MVANVHKQINASMPQSLNLCVRIYICICVWRVNNDIHVKCKVREGGRDREREGEREGVGRGGRERGGRKRREREGEEKREVGRERGREREREEGREEREG